MADAFWKTLFHPFETGLIDPPGKGARALFLNAQPGFRLPQGFEGDVEAIQDFRPLFLALKSDGLDPLPVAEREDFDLALVLCGRHRGQNERWVAEAIRRVHGGGRVVVAGGKTDGIASLRKRIASIVELENHASKHHGVVFWFTVAETAVAEALASQLEAANPRLTLEGGFETGPGMFSHEHVDAASRLLVEKLPDGLKGPAADFGAGWGYLSVELARRAPQLGAIDLYEASFIACEAARRNMASLAPEMAARVVWCDLISEKVERRYNLIAMNPPFHHGRAAEPSMGEAMIRAASRALLPGGRLFLVANRQLPYEPVLQSGFARHGETCRDDRFKVLWAVR